MDMLTLIRGLASIGAAYGIYMLWAAAQKPSRHAIRLLSGWGLVLGSIIAWSFTSGSDKGAALGIIIVVLAALAGLAAIAFQSSGRDVRKAPERAPERQALGWLSYSRLVVVSILMGPVACLSAVTICTAAFLGFQSIGVEHTLNLTIVSFALPVVWGALSIIGAADPKLWRKSLIIFGCGLAPLAYIAAAS